MYSSEHSEPKKRYFYGMNQDQLNSVDSYALYLVNDEDPVSFEQFKKFKEEIDDIKNGVIRGGNDTALRYLQSIRFTNGNGESGSLNVEYLEKILQDNKEFREMLCKVLDGGFMNPGHTIRQESFNLPGLPGGDSSRRGVMNFGQFRPPVPEGIFDGQISKGYSFKFQTDIPVIDKAGNVGLRESDITEHAHLHL